MYIYIYIYVCVYIYIYIYIYVCLFQTPPQGVGQGEEQGSCTGLSDHFNNLCFSNSQTKWLWCI